MQIIMLVLDLQNDILRSTLPLGSPALYLSLYRPNFTILSVLNRQRSRQPDKCEQFYNSLVCPHYIVLLHTV